MTTPLHAAEAIGAALAARLAAVRVANGAETDIGLRVYRGRRAVSDDLIPCVSIIEGDDIPGRTKGAGTTYELDQRYVLFAYVPCDPDHPNTAAHAALRDLKRAVFRTGGKGDRQLGGAVRECAYLGRDIGPRADGARFVVAAIEIGVNYVEDLANP